MPRKKILKGIAVGIADSFISRNNDYRGYWVVGQLCLLAQQLNTCSLSIPLVDLDSSKVLYHPILAAISTNYRAKLITMLVRARTSIDCLSQAGIKISFGSSGLLPLSPNYMSGDPFLCTVSLVDRWGKLWEIQRSGRCRPHDPNRELRSGRI